MKASVVLYFLELQNLKLIYVGISLVGLHILKPFHNLILDKYTTYYTLLNSFPKLNEELNLTSPKDMLTLNQVATFSIKWRHTYGFSEKWQKKWYKNC